MTSDVNVVVSKFLRMFDRFLAGRGMKLAPLLLSHGVDPAVITDAEAEIPMRTFAAVMDDAAQALGNPCLGLEWSKVYPISGTGIFGYLIMHSSNLREGITHSARYANLVMSPVESGVTFEWHDDRETGEYFWLWPPWLGSSGAQYKSLMAALMVLRLRTDTEKPWVPLAVKLQCRELPCHSLVREIFGPNTIFNAPRNSILIDGNDLRIEFAAADHRLLPIIKAQAERLLAELPQRGELVQQVRTAILNRLGKGDVTLEAVATHLKIPVRTLQSRLAQRAETSFESVLNETRQDLARHYLELDDFSLTEIAYLLGYSELSAFTRAAQRWFGTTPSALRQQLRLRVGRG